MAEEFGAAELAAHTDFETMGKLVAVDKEVLVAVADEHEAESESIALSEVLPVALGFP